MAILEKDVEWKRSNFGGGRTEVGEKTHPKVY